MRQHVVSAAEHNLLLSWLQYCMASQHTAVASACLNHFKWNFEQVARTADFVNCDVGLLTSVLAQHDLVVHDEMTLYTYVVSWLKHQQSRLQVTAPEADVNTPRQTANSSSSCRATEHLVPNTSTTSPQHSDQLSLLRLQPKLNFRLGEEPMSEDSSSSSLINCNTAPCVSSSVGTCHQSYGECVRSHSVLCSTCCSYSRQQHHTSFSASNEGDCHCFRMNTYPFNSPHASQQQRMCCMHRKNKCCSSSSQHQCQYCPPCICVSPCCQTQNLHHRVNSCEQPAHCTTSKPHFSTSGGSSKVSLPRQECSVHCAGACSRQSSLGTSSSSGVGGGLLGGEHLPRPNSRPAPPPLQLGTGKLYLRCSGGPNTAGVDGSASKGDDGEGGDLAHQIECLTYEVMSFVRFPMMTPRQLADLLLVPLTIHYKEFFVTRMAIGMAFHSGQWSRVREVVEGGCEASRLLFTPRLYTAEQWSAGLTVDNFRALPPYHSRTLVFSTPASASELENEAQLEWIVELYPKGVWFRKYLLIVWQGTVEVPEAILRCVRLSVTYNSASNTAAAAAADKNGGGLVSPSATCPRVRLAVLVYAYRDGVEFVSEVVMRRHIFTPDDCILNMDDILPFNSLNDPKEAEQYLLQPCNSLKIHVVISPLSPPAYCPPSST